MTKYFSKAKNLTFTFLATISVCIVGALIYLYFHQPQVVIVPHHDVVKELRREVLGQVAIRRFKTRTIVLIAPDHFNPNQHSLTSSNANWTTAAAPVLYDPIVGKSFEPIVTNDSTALKNDHGIYALLPDLAAVFPHAKLVPLLVGQALKPQDLDSLITALNHSCRADCLVIASVDFSHYLPVSMANVHDEYSLKVLNNRDLDHVMDLEVDSPQALYLAIQRAQSQKAETFVLKAHTNSGQLINNYDLETTSHLMGWFERGPQGLDTTQTFVYATNLILDRNHKTVGDRFFYGADITDTQLKEAKNPFTNLFINPTSASTSSISTNDGQLTINLGQDLTVAGSINNHNGYVVLLPLTGTGDDRIFARGLQKQAAIQRLLADIPEPFQVDPLMGTITYPSSSAMPK